MPTGPIKGNSTRYSVHRYITIGHSRALREDRTRRPNRPRIRLATAGSPILLTVLGLRVELLSFPRLRQGRGDNSLFGWSPYQLCLASKTPAREAGK
jgi:hypothetical protein